MRTPLQTSISPPNYIVLYEIYLICAVCIINFLHY